MLRYLTPKMEKEVTEKVGIENFLTYKKFCRISDHLLADTPQTEIQETAALLEVAYHDKVLGKLDQLALCFRDIRENLDDIKVALQTIAENSGK